MVEEGWKDFSGKTSLKTSPLSCDLNDQKKGQSHEKLRKEDSGREISKHKDSEVRKSFAALRNKNEASVVKIRRDG